MTTVMNQYLPAVEHLAADRHHQLGWAHDVVGNHAGNKEMFGHGERVHYSKSTTGTDEVERLWESRQIMSRNQQNTSVRADHAVLGTFLIVRF